MLTVEQLLNSLIEKGWKPRGENVELYGVSKNTFGERIVIFIGNAGGFKKWGCTYRELVSKESGLWQFCVENGMVDDGVEYKGYALVDVDGGAIAKYETGCRYLYSNIEPEFYIMESSLIDEEDLEKFLLDNIKIS